MTPLQMFKFAIKAITDFLKLIYFMAISVCLLHLVTAITSYQFITRYWYCEKPGKYDVLDCNGFFTLLGFVELVGLSSFLAYVFWTWWIREEDVFDPQTQEQWRESVRVGPYGSNESMVREFMRWAGTPESYREDSPYITMTPPCWQFSIWRKHDDSRKTLIGHGNKIAGHLVVNYHVITAAPIDQLYLVIIRQGKDTVVHPLSAFRFTELLPDIMVSPVSEAKGIQLPGLKDAKIKHVHGFQPAYISTDFPQNNASTAGVINHPDSWGMLAYKGSTRPGFSGASYVHGSSIYGIHCHGGVQNVGYSASYVAMRLHNPESSDYYALQAMLRSSRDRDYESRRVNPDEFEVRYQGRYFVIEVEEHGWLEEDYGDGTDYRTPRQERKRDRRWRNNEDWECNILWKSSEDLSEEPELVKITELPTTREIATQTEPLYENAPVELESHAVRKLEAHVAMLNDRLEEEIEARLAQRRTIERLERSLDMFVDATNMKFMQLWTYVDDAELDDMGPLVDVVELECVKQEDQPTPTAPENSSSPTHTLGGAQSASQVDTQSPPAFLNPDPLATLPKASPISGPLLQPTQLETALLSIQNILVEQQKLLSRLEPENNSSSKPGLPSETKSSTLPEPPLSPKRKRRGFSRRAGLTGPAQQASVPLPPIQPSAKPLVGTASGSQTQPTGKSSNNLPASASGPSRKAAAAAIKRSLAAQHAPRT